MVSRTAWLPTCSIQPMLTCMQCRSQHLLMPFTAVPLQAVDLKRFTPCLQRLQGKYASLGIMRTTRDWITASATVAVFVIVFGGNSIYKSVTEARTNVRRKKALASLEKDE